MTGKSTALFLMAGALLLIAADLLFVASDGGMVSLRLDSWLCRRLLNPDRTGIMGLCKADRQSRRVPTRPQLGQGHLSKGRLEQSTIAGQTAVARMAPRPTGAGPRDALEFPWGKGFSWHLIGHPVRE